jgi:hypothetical protein
MSDPLRPIGRAGRLDSDRRFTVELAEGVESGQGEDCLDDLAPSRGIMLSVLLGSAVWVPLIAFWLA